MSKIKELLPAKLLLALCTLALAACMIPGTALADTDATAVAPETIYVTVMDSDGVVVDRTPVSFTPQPFTATYSGTDQYGAFYWKGGIWNFYAAQQGITLTDLLGKVGQSWETGDKLFFEGYDKWNATNDGNARYVCTATQPGDAALTKTATESSVEPVFALHTGVGDLLSASYSDSWENALDGKKSSMRYLQGSIPGTTQNDAAGKFYPSDVTGIVLLKG